MIYPCHEPITNQEIQEGGQWIRALSGLISARQRHCHRKQESNFIVTGDDRWTVGTSKIQDLRATSGRHVTRFGVCSLVDSQVQKNLLVQSKSIKYRKSRAKSCHFEVLDPSLMGMPFVDIVGLYIYIYI